MLIASPFNFIFCNRREYSLQQCSWRRRAAGHCDINRNDVGIFSAAGIAFAKYFTSTAAVANCDGQLRLGGGVKGTLECNFHVP